MAHKPQKKQLDFGGNLDQLGLGLGGSQVIPCNTGNLDQFTLGLWLGGSQVIPCNTGNLDQFTLGLWLDGSQVIPCHTDMFCLVYVYS